MRREISSVLANKKIAPGHYVLTLAAPFISKKAEPGQFVQLLCAESTDPLLPRPFSFLTAGGGKISLLYQVVGKGTLILSKIEKGDKLHVLGPLGVGFSRLNKNKKAILVGGGVGIPPLYHLAQTFLSSPRKRGSTAKHDSSAKRLSDTRFRGNDIVVLLGARSAPYLLCEKDFKALKVNLKAATDDGSKGKKGFVTALLSEILMDADAKSFKIYACGPNPMLKAVSALADEFQVDCEVSVEVPMACGFGACLGCAVPVKEGSGTRFAIACCEGPVFEGKQILW